MGKESLVAAALWVWCWPSPPGSFYGPITQRGQWGRSIQGPLMQLLASDTSAELAHTPSSQTLLPHAWDNPQTFHTSHQEQDRRWQSALGMPPCRWNKVPNIIHFFYICGTDILVMIFTPQRAPSKFTRHPAHCVQTQGWACPLLHFVTGKCTALSFPRAAWLLNTSLTITSSLG